MSWKLNKYEKIKPVVRRTDARHTKNKEIATEQRVNPTNSVIQCLTFAALISLKN